MFPTEPIGEGYLRPDGKKGIRNKLLVVYTVDCSCHTAQRIAQELRARGEDADAVGNRACFDNQANIRRLLCCCVHPNVGAVLVVGHGCEYIRADRVCDFAAAHDRPAEYLLQQECGGTQGSIERGIAAAGRLLAQLRRAPKAPLYLRDLTFGAECGGSDFTSGLAGNPLVGRFYDGAVDAGATCIFEEIAEAVGLRAPLAARAVDETARRELEAAYDKMARQCASAGQFSISPGNFDGGLITIEEKSMGAVAKSGTRPIQGVLKIAQRPPRPGLWLMDSSADVPGGCPNGADSNGIMDMICLGAHVCFLVTGRGHTIGTPISPTLKITGNPRTYARMNGDIDVNAGKLLDGACTLDELSRELFEGIRGICGGKRTKAEALGHREGEFIAVMQEGRTECG